MNRRYLDMLVGALTGYVTAWGAFHLLGLPTFFVHALAFMFVGRYTGWALSRGVLFHVGLVTVVLICGLWGGLVAYGVRMLIDWQQPTVIVRWLMGYGMGAYVAIPDYGLLAEPDARQALTTFCPLMAFGLMSALLARTL